MAQDDEAQNEMTKIIVNIFIPTVFDIFIPTVFDILLILGVFDFKKLCVICFIMSVVWFLVSLYKLDIADSPEFKNCCQKCFFFLWW